MSKTKQPEGKIITIHTQGVYASYSLQSLREYAHGYVEPMVRHLSLSVVRVGNADITAHSLARDILHLVEMRANTEGLSLLKKHIEERKIALVNLTARLIVRVKVWKDWVKEQKALSIRCIETLIKEEAKHERS